MARLAGMLASVAFALAAGATPALSKDAARGQPKAGEAIYARCLACHALAYDRTGPRHCGLFGRRAGSVKDFAYSDAMKRSGGTVGPAKEGKLLGLVGADAAALDRARPLLE